MGWFNDAYDEVKHTGALDPAGLFDRPEGTYLGGSEEELKKRREQYGAGIGIGRGYTDQGVTMSASAVPMLTDANRQAVDMTGQGLGVGRGSMLAQDRALNEQSRLGLMMMDQAKQETPSVAAAQLRMANEQNQRAMMAQASSARGGNQAAAMTGAQATGAQMGLQTNQQAAMIRAAEAQQRQANILSAQQAAASMNGNAAGQLGQRSSMGYGVGVQGLGQQSQIGSNVGSLGLGIAGVGNQVQGTYVGAQTDTDKAQLDADKEYRKALQANKAGAIGGIAGGIVSFGG